MASILPGLPDYTPGGFLSNIMYEVTDLSSPYRIVLVMYVSIPVHSFSSENLRTGIHR